MRLILIFTTIILIQLNVAASDTTLFHRQISYSQGFELAKKEKKSVLLYFHFDGCGACVQMEKTAFVDKKVVSFYDSNFICLEVNTRKGEGIEINKIYNVQLHPTFLFLDSNGNTLNKIVGVFSPDAFVLQGQNALNPIKSLSSFKQKYNNGNRDAEFLFEYCYRLRDANELDSIVINEYLNTQTLNDLNKEKNIKFIYEFMLHKGMVCIPFKSQEYEFMLGNKDLFSPYFDLEQVNTRLMFTAQFDVYNAIEKQDTTAFWIAMDVLKGFDLDQEYNYKEMDDRITKWTTNKSLVLSAMLSFYKKVGNSEKYNETLNLFINKIWDDYEALNAYSWNCYEMVDDRLKLEMALVCIERSIQLNKNYANTDTYASLLYKLGRYDQALEQAEKAIELAKQNKLDYVETSNLITKIKASK